MATATEEMASSASEIARQVARSTSIASRAVEAARNTDRQVQGLAETAQKIEAVVVIINGIASQTGKATEEVGAQIQAIQAATQSAVEAIKGIGITIDEINDISTGIAAVMEEQGATTREMTRSTHQAAQGTHEVSTNDPGRFARRQRDGSRRQPGGFRRRRTRRQSGGAANRGRRLP